MTELNELISTIRPTFELIYFVASIVLIFGVWLSYRQLTLIKEDIRIKNKRAAAEMAIEACDIFSSKYVPLSIAYFADIESLGYGHGHYTGAIGDFSYNSISERDQETCLARQSRPSWFNAMNSLAVIASYFMTGVADESVGFRVLGRGFCASVEASYDLIAFMRKGVPNDYWADIIDLYALWKPRLTKLELELQRQGMDEVISGLKQKTITPIGLI